MHRLITIFLAVFSTITLFAQKYDDTRPPNTYRSQGNPYYWKNNLPYPGYWQQDVHYEIDANVDTEKGIIQASRYKLTYWNNSPHTLENLYFHLYQNAFQPDSYYHILNERNKKKIEFGEYEMEGLNTEIKNLQVNGKDVDTVLDNTIMQVKLNKPLQPNDSIVITCTFDTYFDQGTMRRRMKEFESFGDMHYDGVHWYPIISAFDRKFGWSTDQHLDKEFYADFGTFDVKLTFPQEYIVEATGVLQNREEVLPDTLRQQLDLSNYTDKPFNSSPSTPIPRGTGKTKTWYFHAENVHNFAWTADPNYRIDEQEWNGIQIMTLVQEPHASKWVPTIDFLEDVIKVYSEDFAMYAWPKIIAADANDGMEYPMLTLDSGTWPGHRGLIAHETGHMWYYGMLGTNEQYRAFMDEGFTQFLTVWSYERITGKSLPRVHPWKFMSHKIRPYEVRYFRLYYPYLKWVHMGYDHPLNTHSSDFHTALRHGGGYGLVYYKTGVMLYNLQYVLGDSLFLKAMQHYTQNWMMKHPYPEDFRNDIINFTGVDLNWFFDQWLETTKHIDYAIKKVEKKDNNRYSLQLERKGDMQMPLDITVTDVNDSTYHYHIPNSWFIKDSSVNVLPKWYGWGENLNPEYEAEITLNAPIKTLEIDTTYRLADIDMRNNHWPKKAPVEFDMAVKQTPDWKESHNKWRPDVWYNGFDGLQLGLHVSGNYFEERAFYDFDLRVNTGAIQQSVPEAKQTDFQALTLDMSAKQNISQLWRHLFVSESFDYNAGLLQGQLGLEKRFKKQDAYNDRYTDIFLNTKMMYRSRPEDSLYLLYPSLWSIKRLNSSLNMGIIRTYVNDLGKGTIGLKLRTPSLFSDINHSYLEAENIHTETIGKFDLRSRLYARYDSKQQAIESALYVGGASPEEMYENKFMRAQGFFPTSWYGLGAEPDILQYGGGMNLRGYSGLLFIEATGEQALIARGGASASVEIGFEKLVHIKSNKLKKWLHLEPYVFGDAGAFRLQDDEFTLSDFYADAGLGAALSLKFGYFDLNPLVLRFDLPMYLNQAPNGQDNFENRFVFGVERSF